MQKTLHGMQIGEIAMECFAIRLIPPSGRRLIVCIRILRKRKEILGLVVHEVKILNVVYDDTRAKTTRK